VTLLAWAWLASSAATAQPCTLEAVRGAVVHGWSAVETALDDSAAAAARAAAGVDAPELRVGVDNLDPDATPPGAAWMFRVPVPAPWVEVAQRRLGAAEDAERRAEVRALVAAGAGEVTEAYGDLLAAQGRIHAAQQGLSAAQALVTFRQRSADAGTSTRTSALEALEDAAQWRARVAAAEADRAEAEATLRAWLPDLDTLDCAPVAAPPMEPPPGGQGEGEARAARLEATARLARAEGLPWVEAVRATFTTRPGARPDGGIGVNVRLPWPSGHPAEAAALEGEAAIARLADADAQRSLLARYLAAWSRWTATEDAARVLAQDTPAAPAAAGSPEIDLEARAAWTGLAWWSADAHAEATQAAAAVWALRPP